MENGKCVVVITGVTRGLGRAMVEQFISLGHTVAGCGRSKKDIEALRKQFPKPHDFAALDVTAEDEVAKWAKRIIAELGAPDLLLNNAALMNTPASLWKVPADEFSAV